MTWPQDGKWITVQTCHQGVPGSLTVDDILEIAASTLPGTTVSTQASSL
jgi:hypothetical protein